MVVGGSAEVCKICQNLANLGHICENLSRWGFAALTLPLHKHTGVCPYVDEERSAGKSQEKIDMYSR